MINDIFKKLFDETFTPKGETKSFSSAWQIKSNNPLSRMGRRARSGVSDLGAELEATRASSDPTDFESYFADLDEMETRLSGIGDMLATGTGDPIKDRASLRLVRDKAVRERMRAKDQLTRTEGGNYMDESSSYTDPLTGEITTVRGEQDRKTYGFATDKLMQEAGRTFDQMFAERGGDVLSLINARGDSLSSGNEDMIREQLRTGFQQLGSTSAINQMQAMESEMTLRQEQALSEVERRRKANQSVTDMERKRVTQVKSIEDSIKSINTMFVQTDSQFAAAESQPGTTGVDFRADRPN